MYTADRFYLAYECVFLPVYGDGSDDIQQI
jgi:hypothetical protein